MPGQVKGKIHPSALEERGDDDVWRQRHLVLERLVNQRLARAHKTQGQTGPPGAGTKAFLQPGQQVVTHHGLQLPRRPGQRHEGPAGSEVEEQPHRRAVRVGKETAPRGHLTLAAQIRAQLLARLVEPALQLRQGGLALFQRDAGELAQRLAGDVVGRGAQAAGYQHQGRAVGGKTQSRQQVLALIVRQHGAGAAQPQRMQGAGQEMRVRVRIHALEQFAAGDHQAIPDGRWPRDSPGRHLFRTRTGRCKTEPKEHEQNRAHHGKVLAISPRPNKPQPAVQSRKSAVGWDIVTTTTETATAALMFVGATTCGQATITPSRSPACRRRILRGCRLPGPCASPSRAGFTATGWTPIAGRGRTSCRFRGRRAVQRTGEVRQRGPGVSGPGAGVRFRAGWIPNHAGANRGPGFPYREGWRP